MPTNDYVEVWFDGIARKYHCDTHWDAIVLVDALVASGRFKSVTRWTRDRMGGWVRMQEWMK